MVDKDYEEKFRTELKRLGIEALLQLAVERGMGLRDEFERVIRIAMHEGFFLQVPPEMNALYGYESLAEVMGIASSKETVH